MLFWTCAIPVERDQPAMRTLAIIASVIVIQGIAFSIGTSAGCASCIVARAGVTRRRSIAGHPSPAPCESPPPTTAIIILLRRHHGWPGTAPSTLHAASTKMNDEHHHHHQGEFDHPVPSRTAEAARRSPLTLRRPKRPVVFDFASALRAFQPAIPSARARGEPVSPTQGDVDQRRKTNRSVSQFTQTPPKSAANCSFTPSGPANGVRNQRPKGQFMDDFSGGVRKPRSPSFTTVRYLAPRRSEA